MIRFVACYSIAVDDFATVDAFGDRLMGALLLADDVLEPDLAVSMTERTLELRMLIATDDSFEAVDIGNRTIRAAFAAAGHDVPTSSLWVHRDLFRSEIAVHTELVDA